MARHAGACLSVPTGSDLNAVRLPRMPALGTEPATPAQPYWARPGAAGNLSPIAESGAHENARGKGALPIYAALTASTG